MDTNKKKVIIVEDSPTVRYEVKLLLQKLNAELIEVGSEIGLFMKIDEYNQQTDLIIMDLMLKHENGLDIIEKLKAHEKHKDIPVMILSEHSEMQSVLKAKKLAVSAYIIKPINKDDFIKRVTSIFDENK